MKTSAAALPLLGLAAALALPTTGLADIRHYHGGTRIGLSIGFGDVHGRHHHGHHRHHHHGLFHPGHWDWSHSHHRHPHHRHHGSHFGFSYNPLFAPAWYSSYPAYRDRDYGRTVVIRERAPEPVRASTYAPVWSPGGGWQTHGRFQSAPMPLTATGGLRDARSAEQLQQIYGSQGASLTR